MNVRAAARMAKIEQHPQISDALISEHIRVIQRRLGSALGQLSQSDATLFLFMQDRVFHYATLAPDKPTNYEEASEDLLEALAYGYELSPALRDELESLPPVPAEDVRNPAAWLRRKLSGLTDWEAACEELRRAAEIINEANE